MKTVSSIHNLESLKTGYQKKVKSERKRYDEQVRLAEKFKNIEIPDVVYVNFEMYPTPRMTVNLLSEEEFRAFRKNLKGYGQARLESLSHNYGDRFHVTYGFSVEPELKVSFMTEEPERFLKEGCRVVEKTYIDKQIVCEL